MRTTGTFIEELRAYRDLIRRQHEAEHSGQELVFSAQCECVHWGHDHCMECGACQKCDCQRFEAG